MAVDQLQDTVEEDTSWGVNRHRCVVTESSGFWSLFLEAAGEFAAVTSCLESKMQSLQGTW